MLLIEIDKRPKPSVEIYLKNNRQKRTAHNFFSFLLLYLYDKRIKRYTRLLVSSKFIKNHSELNQAVISVYQRNRKELSVGYQRSCDAGGVKTKFNYRLCGGEGVTATDFN